MTKRLLERLKEALDDDIALARRKIANGQRDVMDAHAEWEANFHNRAAAMIAHSLAVDYVERWKSRLTQYENDLKTVIMEIEIWRSDGQILPTVSFRTRVLANLPCACGRNDCHDCTSACIPF